MPIISRSVSGARRFEDVRTPILLSNGIIHFYRSPEYVEVEEQMRNSREVYNTGIEITPAVTSIVSRVRRYEDVRTPVSLSNGVFKFYRPTSSEFGGDIDTQLLKMKDIVAAEGHTTSVM